MNFYICYNLSMKRKDLAKFIIVNLITFSRVIGAIILPIIYFVSGIKSLAFFVVLLFLTDMIDGKLSRLWKVESFLGSLLDGVGDKLFAFVILAILSYEYPLVLIVIFLEVIIFVINTLALSEHKNIKSSKVGKIKTAILDIAISILYIYRSVEVYGKFLPVRIVKFMVSSEATVSSILIGIMIGAQIFTISDYNKKRLRQVTEFTKLKNKKIKSFNEIVYMLTSREFYIKNRDGKLMDFLYEE